MKLYVGNLGEEGDVKSSDLRPLFERFGPVSECECIKNYAYVYYDSYHFNKIVHHIDLPLFGR